jgi:hypothetical protein
MSRWWRFSPVSAIPVGAKQRALQIIFGSGTDRMNFTAQNDRWVAPRYIVFIADLRHEDILAIAISAADVLMASFKNNNHLQQTCGFAARRRHAAAAIANEVC